ncbi:hypothetical protein, partial [Aeromonas veronii]|uniref:hypothetical protein n=2 Tax=Aeromonas veronii TaxID=654 RepID=UPI003D262DA4
GSLSRYSKSTVRRHRRVSHFEVEFALELAIADIEQGRSYRLDEALSALAQRRPIPEPSGSRDWDSFFDSEPASADFLTEREDVITEECEPDLGELPPDALTNQSGE